MKGFWIGDWSLVIGHSSFDERILDFGLILRLLFEFRLPTSDFCPPSLRESTSLAADQLQVWSLDLL
jgi:hypothetical protein